MWNLHSRECVEKIPDGSECVTGCGYMCASGFCRERFPTWLILYYLPLAIGKILNLVKWSVHWYHNSFLCAEYVDGICGSTQNETQELLPENRIGRLLCDKLRVITQVL